MAGLSPTFANPPPLSLASFEASFHAWDDVDLPQFPGPMWRRSFGYALRRTVCPMLSGACRDCDKDRRCPYSQVFESRPPAHGLLRGEQQAPHPYVLVLPADGPGRIARGAEYRLGFRLFGAANRYFVTCLMALARAACEGIGTRRRRLLLDRVDWLGPKADSASREIVFREGGLVSLPSAEVPVVPPAPCLARVRFLTPLRLTRDDRLLGPSDITAGDLLSSLVRRVSVLCQLEGKPLEVDFRALKRAAATAVIVERHLAWGTLRDDGEDRKTPCAGLAGEVLIHLGENSPLWPFLWLGQWVNAGRSTAMGLGAISVSAV